VGSKSQDSNTAVLFAVRMSSYTYGRFLFNWPIFLELLSPKSEHIILVVINKDFTLAVVGRSEDDDCVGVEEIDSLQLELEILLASAAKRMRYIHNELTLLDEWIEKGTVTTVSSDKDKAIAAAATAASQQEVSHQNFH